MLPAEAIVRAASRWLVLLETSSFAEAGAILRTNTDYSDLTYTQYSLGLEWLDEVGLIVRGDQGYVVTVAAARLSPEERNQLLFMKAVEVSDRPWLPDADLLIQNVEDLPEDAVQLGASLGLSEDSTLVGIRQVHGHIDLELRRVIGGAGERALVAALEHQWPGTAVHVALENDGYGYDVAFQQPGGRSWHLEVKSTTRQGRLVLHLSRQEHDVGRLDPAWRLLVAGLNSDHELECLATGTGEALFARAPRDTPVGAKWQSASYELGPGDLRPGLDFLDAPSPGLDPVFGSGTRKAPSSFAWMPVAAAQGRRSEDWRLGLD
jgi:hypothetical protein